MSVLLEVLFLCGYDIHRDLHSFPTRRSSDLAAGAGLADLELVQFHPTALRDENGHDGFLLSEALREQETVDRKSTRLNSSHVRIAYAVFCLTKKSSGWIAASQLLL